MAEALAVVGAVASIVDLAAKAAKAVKRIHEFQTSARDIPEAYAGLWIEIPALKATVGLIEEAGRSGELDETQCKVLNPLIRNCIEQICLLEDLLSGLVRGDDDSRLTKLKKGVRSLQKDKTVENAVKLLRNYHQTLASYCLLVSFSSTARDAQETKRKDILRWLSAPDPHSNYYGALKTRHSETGQWLVQDERYIRWKDHASALWLHGVPGSGKTVLASTILEDVLNKSKSDPGEVVAFFFFDFNDPRKQVSRLMLQSLVGQIFSQMINPGNELTLLYAACNGVDRQPTEEELLVVLRDMLEYTPRTYIVIDALDECGDRIELMDVINQIGSWEAPDLHLFLTSRREQDIEFSLRVFIEEDSIICLRNCVVNDDIRLYVQQRLSNDRSLVKWRKDASILMEIEAALMEGANGMFRWAVCQLDALSKCRNRATLHKALKSLPSSLDETYDRILCTIDENDADYAYRILYWLAFSKRPLRIEEVAETIAISGDREPAFDRDEVLEDPREALSLCLSLVSIDSDVDKQSLEPDLQDSDATFVVLAHYSVKEYLISERIHQGRAKRYGMSESLCHNLIAESCLHYLLQIREPQVDSADWLDRNALAPYSAMNWSYHVQANGEILADALHRLVYSLFTSKAAFANWLKIDKPDEEKKSGGGGGAEVDKRIREQLSDMPSPLYYACMLGLTRVAEQLITRENAEVDARGGRFGSPLQAAAIGRHEAAARLLVARGADVNLQVGRHGNALSAACVGGGEGIFRFLLDAGASVDSTTSGRYHTPLQAAAIEGRTGFVKTLLDRGAKVNANGGRYGTALQAAAIGGWEPVAKLLLDGGADTNIEGGRYGSALQAAAITGNAAMVKLLLGHGADPAWRGGRYGSALQAAAIGGHDGIVELLLASLSEKMADNAEDKINETTTLRDMVNASSGDFGSALQASSRRGNTSAVRALLDAGADVDCQGNAIYGTPMQEALAGKHEQVVVVLREVSEQ